MTAATLLETNRPKTTRRLYISGRGAIGIQDIKDNVGTPMYLTFTIDHGIGSVGLHAELVTDLGDDTITFEGVTSDDHHFTAFYDGASFTGNLDILES